MSKNQRALECIRCGDCIKACPTSAISTSFKNKNFNKGDINEKYLFEDK